MENKPAVTNNTLSWDAPEYEQFGKTSTWYIGFGILAAGLIIFAIFSHSIMTIILFALIVMLVFIYSHRSPSVLKHKLTAAGIAVGDSLYPYKEIKKFWIIYHPPLTRTLNIETTAYLNRLVTLQLGNQDPLPIKMFLKKYLVEDLNQEESMTDIIARHMRL